MNYRIPNPLPLILLLLGILLFGLFSCNTVKKSTDTKISKTDSSSQVKTDSTVQEKKAISFDSSSLKTWDKETTIEFEKPEISKPDDTTSYDYRIIGYEDGLTKVKGRIKSITIREKGMDSSNLKKVENSEKKIDLSKKADAKLSKFDKAKTSNKESFRLSTPLVIGLTVAGILIVFFFLAYKRSQAVLPNKENNNGKA